MENDDPEDATSSASPCILRNPNSYDVFLSHRGPDVNLTRDRDATSFASSSTSPSHGNPFASSSTSPSHGNPNSYVYDVFLNHRGPDVKTTLASHLYYRLEEHGLRAFFDKQELQKGEKMKPQIEGAIQTASVHIAIFSPNYAQSSWCLNELVQMLESGKRILPVFYGVKPSDLRWTRGGHGVYARSLDVLGKKRTWDSQPLYDSNTIKKWRDALSEVADISGFELKAFNGDEGELVDNIVQSVKTVFRDPLVKNLRRLDFSGVEWSEWSTVYLCRRLFISQFIYVNERRISIDNGQN
jgi:hypothetical protein